MNPKTSFRLTAIFLYISLFFGFFESTTSQPVIENSLKPNNNNNNDNDSIWIRPLSDSDSDESNAEDNKIEELSQLVQKLSANNEHDQDNLPNSVSPVRRANFWKRANFWRKRANFWRRDLTA